MISYVSKVEFRILNIYAAIFITSVLEGLLTLDPILAEQKFKEKNNNYAWTHTNNKILIAHSMSTVKINNSKKREKVENNHNNVYSKKNYS